MRYGKFLPPSGNIGLIAPAFGCATEPYHSAFNHALEKFHELGYQTVLGPNCYKDDGIGISSTPKLCGEELTSYYKSVDNDVLMTCGGGELMCEILDHVDFEAIRKADPKWYMGFSDNTNMTFLLATLCDVASIYGPCAPAFGMEPWHASLEDAFGILTGSSAKNNTITVHNYGLWERESQKDEEHPLAPYHATEKQQLYVYYPNLRQPSNENNETDDTEAMTKETLNQEEKCVYRNAKQAENKDHIFMSGRLIGGCMDCLGTLLGTRFDEVDAFKKRYADDGVIWFLEACDLNVMSIRRYLWQMAHAGWFDGASGFLIGRPMQYDAPMFGLDQYEAVLGVLRQYNVPVILDADIGHLPPMMPLITGSMADVRLDGNHLEINMHLR